MGWFVASGVRFAVVGLILSRLMDASRCTTNALSLIKHCAYIIAPTTLREDYLGKDMSTQGFLRMQVLYIVLGVSLENARERG